MKKYLSVIMAIVVILTSTFISIGAVDEANATEAGNLSKRVFEAETALNTMVYDNGDGTYTMDVYAMDIKYMDQAGKVVDKSNRLILDVNDTYYNPDNNITTRFPKNLSAGVSLQYDTYDITMTPIVSSKSFVERIALQATENKISMNPLGFEATAEVTGVEYSEVFSNNISIRYYPMFNGIKEEIVLEKYEGINEFQFVLETNGLEVSDDGGVIYLIDPEKQSVVGHISDIVIFDSSARYTTGELAITEIQKAEEYRLIVTAPVEYLMAADTVYPVTIDPSFTISVTSDSNKEIQDSPVYAGWPSMQPGSSYYNNVGYGGNTNYGYSRSLTKFPGLMENIEDMALTSDRITSVTYKTYCVEAESGSIIHIYQYPGSTWEESTVSYSNSGMASVSLGNYLLDSVTVSAQTSTSFSRYSFDITDYILGCIDGTANPDKGVVLKNSNETSSAKFVRFASTEYSDSAYWPTVSVTYTSLTSNDFWFYVYDANTGAPISGATVYAYRPKTNVNQAYPVPTGYTTNVYGAVVFDKTELPYPDVYAYGYGINVVAPGYAQYTSPNADKYSGSTLHMVPMYSVDNYPDYNSPFAAGVECTTPSMSANQHWGWRYLNDVDYHTGVDVGHAKGTPLYSVTNSGTVTVSSVTAGAGHYVIIKSGIYYTAYLHMNTRLVNAGTSFSSRTQVGTVGKTGGGDDGLTESYAAHLHISVGTNNEIRKDGRGYLDPLAFIPFE